METSRTAAGDQHDEADQRELERTRLGRVTRDEQTGGGDQRQGKGGERLEQGREDDPGARDGGGIAHWRYRTSRVATSVGPGTVLTTARAARSDPTACGQESPGTRTRVGPALAT